MKPLLQTLVWLCLLGQPILGHPAFGEMLTGEWRGSVFFHRITAQLEQAKTNVRGVVQVRGFFGGVNTYHFAGSLNGTHLNGSHHHGSTFEGDLVSADRATGVATTRRGRKLRLTLNKQPAPGDDTDAP